MRIASFFSSEQADWHQRPAGYDPCASDYTDIYMNRPASDYTEIQSTRTSRDLSFIFSYNNEFVWELSLVIFLLDYPIYMI